MKQWMKYVGYHQWDWKSAGQQIYFPGPIDNSDLFEGQCRGIVYFGWYSEQHILWRLCVCLNFVRGMLKKR